MNHWIPPNPWMTPIEPLAPSTQPPAMRYFLLEEQDGGCDYTIGCGFRLTELEGVTTMADAVAAAKGYDKHKEPRLRTENDEISPNRARVLAVAETVEIDLRALRTEREGKRQQEAKQSAEERERRLLDELKAKYEKTP